MCKKDCRDKKCKRNCVEFNFEYDQTTVTFAAPVIDKYPNNPTGSPVTLSIFGYTKFTSVPIPSEEGLLQFTDSVFIKNDVPGGPAQVTINGTGTLSDGVTTISFILSFISQNGDFLLPAGVYKTTAYSSTGKFNDKNCYITIRVPEAGSFDKNVKINLKVCDRKSCANK